jgi:hypothetical protein
MGEDRNAYKVLVEKPAGRKPLETPAHRWEDNMDIKRKIMCGHRLHSFDSEYGTIEKLFWLPYDVENFWTR